MDNAPGCLLGPVLPQKRVDIKHWGCGIVQERKGIFYWRTLHCSCVNVRITLHWMYSRKWKISFCENWRRKNIHGRWWCCLVVEQISNQRQHLAVAQNVCPLQIWTVLKLWYWGNILKVIILRKYIETSLQNDSIVVLSIQTGLTLLRSAKCIVFERDMLCSLNSNVCTFPQHSKLSDLSGQHGNCTTQTWPGLGDGRAHSLKASVPQWEVPTSQTKFKSRKEEE